MRKNQIWINNTRSLPFFLCSTTCRYLPHCFVFFTNFLPLIKKTEKKRFYFNFIIHMLEIELYNFFNLFFIKISWSYDHDHMFFGMLTPVKSGCFFKFFFLTGYLGLMTRVMGLQLWICFLLSCHCLITRIASLAG